MQASTRSRNKPNRRGADGPPHVRAELSGVDEREAAVVPDSALTGPRRGRVEAIQARWPFLGLAARFCSGTVGG